MLFRAFVSVFSDQYFQHPFHFHEIDNSITSGDGIKRHAFLLKTIFAMLRQTFHEFLELVFRHSDVLVHKFQILSNLAKSGTRQTVDFTFPRRERSFSAVILAILECSSSAFPKMLRISAPVSFANCSKLDFNFVKPSNSFYGDQENINL